MTTAARGSGDVAATGGVPGTVDAEQPVTGLLRDLRTTPHGLSSAEAARRLDVFGRNEIREHTRAHASTEFLRQLSHPLALLLWAGAGLAWLGGIVEVAVAVVVVIVLNAVFAFWQERQAEHAVETLAAFLPQQVKVLRDGTVAAVPATGIVPGDVLRIEEGDRISADARLLSGSLEVDTSTLTGESVPVARSAAWPDTHVPLLSARNLVFSGTSCTGGQADALVVATGARTELGRIATLSRRSGATASPLERQVRSVAWLIALVAVCLAAAFMPLATLGGGLSLPTALTFAVGLIVGNVPEGLLPVITLALALGVRELARRGAVVKRLSAVETLGSTDVICTDKTGTLTENHMRVEQVWTTDGEATVAAAPDTAPPLTSAPLTAAFAVMVSCNNARAAAPGGRGGDGGTAGRQAWVGDPTETALLDAATTARTTVDETRRDQRRVRHFAFDPVRRMMTTVDDVDGAFIAFTKGAPEAVLPACTSVMAPDGSAVTLTDERRRQVLARADDYAARGLRVLALADRRLMPDASATCPDRQPEAPPADRDGVERGLRLVGLVTLMDPPRPEVAPAVASCHTAGISVIVVSGDHPRTAAAVAKAVGIGGDDLPVVTGAELAGMDDPTLAAVLRRHRHLVFARTSPEDKLRIADALRAAGHTVAMTGDGVNDAPALRHADIGVAMGRGGTDVAREAATMVLTDDNFATIVTAVQAGRRVYDNIRKFIFYIFTHATPEIVPYLVFALARGAVPLPLTVLQLLSVDVGTEILPALALGREPAEPGLMTRPPRPRDESVIRSGMLVRAWLFLGVLAAALEMGAFFHVLLAAGWHPGDATGAGSPLHHAYRQATTVTLLSMVMCQVGTAFAARTDRVSLRSVGLLSNPLLLWGVGAELALTACLIYIPACQAVLGTAALPPHLVLLTLPFPFAIWGADELRRLLRRRRSGDGTVSTGPAARLPAEQLVTRPAHP